MTKSNELEKRVEALEAFLELSDGYSVEKGQGLIAQRERKKQLRAEATKMRLEKEKLPPRINITTVSKGFSEGEPYMAYINMREEGAQISRHGYIGPEAFEQLQEGNLEGLRLVYMKKDIGRAIPDRFTLFHYFQ